MRLQSLARFQCVSGWLFFGIQAWLLYNDDVVQLRFIFHYSDRRLLCFHIQIVNEYNYYHRAHSRRFLRGQRGIDRLLLPNEEDEKHATCARYASRTAAGGRFGTSSNRGRLVIWSERHRATHVLGNRPCWITHSCTSATARSCGRSNNAEPPPQPRHRKCAVHTTWESGGRWGQIN